MFLERRATRVAQDTLLNGSLVAGNPYHRVEGLEPSAAMRRSGTRPPSHPTAREAPEQ
jgi:hypothetical protein